MATPIADRVGRRTRRGLLVALVGALAVLLAPGPAAAQDRSLTAAEAAALAREAATDDGALRALRAVQEIDGRRVDLAAATTSLGSDRAARLGVLADELGRSRAGSGGTDGAADARRSARGVLRDQRYRERDVPKPFRRPLAWLADRLRPVGRFLQRIFRPVLDLPGGPAILAVLFIAAGGAFTAWLISRRSRALVSRAGRSRLVDPSLDPSDLERRAEEAEATDDLTGAVRLRYLAGLLRLARDERLVLRRDTTAAGAARQVGLPAMDRLTADFEEIVYGDRRPTVDDVGAARAGWAEVLGARPAGRAR